jgi:hypothetical protein
VRGRLEDLLAQYELRERHFEAVIRSKQLELLLAKARVDEQKQLASNAHTVEQQVGRLSVECSKPSTNVGTLRRGQDEQLSLKIDTTHKTQAIAMDKLVACGEDVRDPVAALISFSDPSPLGYSITIQYYSQVTTN